MTAAPSYLLYLSYGSEELHAEALYSLLSYYEVAVKPVQILIYTDSPASFEQVLGVRPGIVYPAVTLEEWQQQ
jgi:hypothetical protein